MLREYTCDSASDTHRRCGVGLLSQQVSQPPADGVSIHRRLGVAPFVGGCFLRISQKVLAFFLEIR